MNDFNRICPGCSKRWLLPPHSEWIDIERCEACAETMTRNPLHPTQRQEQYERKTERGRQRYHELKKLN